MDFILQPRSKILAGCQSLNRRTDICCLRPLRTIRIIINKFTSAPPNTGSSRQCKCNGVRMNKWFTTLYISGHTSTVTINEKSYSSKSLLLSTNSEIFFSVLKTMRRTPGGCCFFFSSFFWGLNRKGRL